MSPIQVMKEYYDNDLGVVSKNKKSEHWEYDAIPDWDWGNKDYRVLGFKRNNLYLK